MQNQDYARTQADALDNIAPSPQQAAAASQFAVTDNFLSSEEQAAVLKQINAERPALQRKLDEVGIIKEYLASNPDVEKALFSGQATPVLTLSLPNDLQLQGRLRIALTEEGPQLRVTPVHAELSLPEKVGGLQLTQQERDDLKQKGYTDKAIQMPENGGYVASFLRVDKETNTVDVWRVAPESLPTKLLGVDLTRDQQIALVCGHPVKLSGLKDQQGESFDATVSISPGKKGLEFSEIGRPDVKITPSEKHKEQVAQNNEGAKTDVTKGLEEKVGYTVVTNDRKETLQRLMTAEEKPAQQKRQLKP